MTTITSTSDTNYYQVFMEPPKDSSKMREFLHNIHENAHEGFFKSHFVTTGYAVLIWATSFFEVLKFSGKCLCSCVIEIWYLDFSEVKQHLQNDSQDCLQSIKYSICMPFVIFSGLFFPDPVYSSLEYPQVPTEDLERVQEEIQNLRDDLAAAQQGPDREQLQSELDTERRNLQRELQRANQESGRADRAEGETLNLRNDLDVMLAAAQQEAPVKEQLQSDLETQKENHQIELERANQERERADQAELEAQRLRNDLAAQQQGPDREQLQRELSELESKMQVQIETEQKRAEGAESKLEALRTEFSELEQSAIASSTSKLDEIMELQGKLKEAEKSKLEEITRLKAELKEAKETAAEAESLANDAVDNFEKMSKRYQKKLEAEQKENEELGEAAVLAVNELTAKVGDLEEGNRVFQRQIQELQSQLEVETEDKAYFMEMAEGLGKLMAQQREMYAVLKVEKSELLLKLEAEAEKRTKKVRLESKRVKSMSRRTVIGLFDSTQSSAIAIQESESVKKVRALSGRPRKKNNGGNGTSGVRRKSKTVKEKK